jgi:hydrogenase maturation protease
MGILIGGVGYAWQGDLAFGLAVLDALRDLSWSSNAEVADLSYNPIAVFQQIRARRYTQITLVGAVQRGRAPGALYTYRPVAPLPPLDEIQERIVESGSGIISLDNIVCISRFYDALPLDTQIVEIEPVDDHWGADLSPPARAAVDEALTLIRGRIAGPRRASSP